MGLKWITFMHVKDSLKSTDDHLEEAQKKGAVDVEKMVAEFPKP